MPIQTKAEIGQWNVECTSCGGYYKQRDIEVNPNNGFLVCFRCQEPYCWERFFKYPVSNDPGKVYPTQGTSDEFTEEAWWNQRWVIDHYEDIID